MKMKIETIVIDNVPNYDVEVVDVESQDLIEAVANFSDMNKDQLVDLIKTKRWNGGCWKHVNNVVIFESDVTITKFSFE